ncbi:substrate-binding domain-containing protein [Microbacterium sp. IEGM 1404]|uniref:substrate-binding domain-containing protein n=1 Tax=Microbacterium sp. IEGM 1404 TaxID=3047084 RepID=UPI0024B6F12B|nr:substrate-binding domain-containing protein [Microbacterium sp. IEGM 1404]MDI9889819.1 substrate-binding domain-containing protein [Microbacterium sp. IEGM 1404]
MTSRRPLSRALLVFAAVALALAGCTSSTRTETATNDGAGVVGVALPTADDLAVERLGEALRDELRARGYRVDLQYAAGDARTQISQVQNMVTKGEEAVVLVPLSADALDGARAAADGAGAPLVTAGRALDEGGAVEAFDPAATGRAQATALLEALARDDDAARDDPATVAIVAGVAGVAEDPEAAAAHAAATEVLAAGPVRIIAGADLESAAVADLPRDVEIAGEERVRALYGTPGSETPDAILALGDAVGRGVVTALTTPDPDATASPSPTASADPEAVPPPPPVVVTSGGDALTVRALRNGVVAATVFVDTRAGAGPVADAVVAALDGEEPTPSAGPPPTTVERDAVESVFLESGWLGAEDLSG